MCGRYHLINGQDMFVLVDDEVKFLFSPRYNVSPTNTMPVVLLEDGKPTMRPMKWGLIPFWSDEPKTGYSTINARAEELTQKPLWKSVLKHRCLVPADGYYEWTGPKTARLPWRFHCKDDSVFYFAGLWSRWQKGNADPVDSYTIITTAADDFTGKIHTRMPVIMREKNFAGWFNETDFAKAGEYLEPADSKPLQVERVNTIVNKSGNETPQCVEPA